MEPLLILWRSLLVLSIFLWGVFLYRQHRNWENIFSPEDMSKSSLTKVIYNGALALTIINIVITLAVLFDS